MISWEQVTPISRAGRALLQNDKLSSIRKMKEGKARSRSLSEFVSKNAHKSKDQTTMPQELRRSKRLQERKNLL